MGCGLCAKSCPYDSISIEPNHKHMAPQEDAPENSAPILMPTPKAAVCDLCDTGGSKKPVPRCVYACPHDAAHRMTGEEFLAKVTERELAGS